MSTKTRISVFMLCLLLAMPVLALADEAGELRKKIIFDQKKLVVIQNMEFTEKEKKEFWPVYQKFQEELFPLSQRTVELVLAYASVFQSLSNDQAAKIVEEYLTIQDSRQKVMRKYFQEFMKILPAKKVFRYLQIENKLNAVGRYELAQEIPLAK
jgi:uncharacterized protein (UPF0371 family)